MFRAQTLHKEMFNGMTLVSKGAELVSLGSALEILMIYLRQRKRRVAEEGTKKKGIFSEYDKQMWIF